MTSNSAVRGRTAFLWRFRRIATMAVAVVAAVGLTAACTHRAAAPPPANFRPVALDVNWTVTPWLAPNQLAAATSVVVNAAGEIFAAQAWNTVSLIAPHDGRWFAVNVVDDPRTADVEEKLRVYSLAVDAHDRLWGYNFTRGDLSALVRERQCYYRVKTFHFDELFTTGESLIAAGPGDRVLIAVNRPRPEGGARSEIYQFDPRREKLTQAIAFDDKVKTLAWQPRTQRLYLALGRGLYELDLATRRSQAILSPFPERVSFGGLAAAAGGDLYVATGDWAERGRVYQVSAGPGPRTATPIYETHGPGLQGIALVEAGRGAAREDILYGVCRRTGDLLRLPLRRLEPNADYRIIAGNGVAVPQILSWDPGAANRPAGLIVSDGETGRLLRLRGPNQPPATIAELANYSHLGSQMAIDRATGRIFFAIDAPGFEKQFGVLALDPLGEPSRRSAMAAAAPGLRPGSVAILPDGALLVDNLQEQGQLLRVDREGKIDVLTDAARLPELRYPLGLAIGDGGAIFVGVASIAAPRFAGVPWSDSILMLTRNAAGWSAQRVFDGRAPRTGEHEPMCPAIDSFAVDARGAVYVACDKRILRAAPPYAPAQAQVFADHFQYALGMTFDDAGGLFVSDGETSSIWRFAPNR